MRRKVKLLKALPIMKKMGDGVYHGISDGEHTHTLSNFHPGRDSDI